MIRTSTTTDSSNSRRVLRLKVRDVHPCVVTPTHGLTQPDFSSSVGLPLSTEAGAFAAPSPPDACIGPGASRFHPLLAA